MSKAENVTIRLAEAKDRAQWEPLFLAYGVFYETAFSPVVLDGVWQWILDDTHPLSAFVAVRDNTLLGFAHLREQADTFVAGPSWFLDDLFTTPETRGQGVGRALIDAVTSHAAHHGGGDLRWITAADNNPAHYLYDSLATKTSWVLYEKKTQETP